MTVQGQTMVSYTFDNANRLTQMSQGTTAVGLAYDVADRRTVPIGWVPPYDEFREAPKFYAAKCREWWWAEGQTKAAMRVFRPAQLGTR